MASSSTFAMILVFVAVAGVLSAEAAGRPSGTLQPQGWNGGDGLHVDKDANSGSSLQRFIIPSNQDSLLRVSPLDAERTAKYLTQINDNTLGFHSAQFCQEAQLQCRADMAIVDPTLRISQSSLVDQELFQRTRNLVDATRAMQFDRKDIVKGREIEVPMSLRDSYPAASFLPQALAEKMPLTRAQLPELFEKLSIPEDSNLAIMMSRTVGQCEAHEQGKEIRKCVTSLEGMKLFVSSNLPQDKRIVALERSSSIPGAGESRGTNKAKPSSSTWKVLDTKQYDRAVVCRNSVFPFAVFECHDTSKTTTSSGNMRIFQVEMQSRNDGSRISEVAACHENAVHAAGTMGATDLNRSNNPEPAQACHWITDSLIWAPAN